MPNWCIITSHHWTRVLLNGTSTLEALLDCREVQRILMELLNQMDGFDQNTNVKVIMATNRADTLDPALLRPGRLDRKIEFPLPDRRQKRLVFQVGAPLRPMPSLPPPACPTPSYFAFSKQRVSERKGRQ